jgi:hypothetical protein
MRPVGGWDAEGKKKGEMEEEKGGEEEGKR